MAIGGIPGSPFAQSVDSPSRAKPKDLSQPTADRQNADLSTAQQDSFTVPDEGLYGAPAAGEQSVWAQDDAYIQGIVKALDDNDTSADIKTVHLSSDAGQPPGASQQDTSTPPGEGLYGAPAAGEQSVWAVHPPGASHSDTTGETTPGFGHDPSCQFNPPAAEKSSPTKCNGHG